MTGLELYERADALLDALRAIQHDVLQLNVVSTIGERLAHFYDSLENFAIAANDHPAAVDAVRYLVGRLDAIADIARDLDIDIDWIDHDTEDEIAHFASWLDTARPDDFA